MSESSEKKRVFIAGVVRSHREVVLVDESGDEVWCKYDERLANKIKLDMFKPVLPNIASGVLIGWKSLVGASLGEQDSCADSDDSPREALLLQNAALRAEVARLKKMLGRDDPTQCALCGEIREKSEKNCGNCLAPLDIDGGKEK